jgi:nucleoside-diphosphate-sugar epimerase
MIGSYLDNVPSGVEFYQIDCNDFGRLNEHPKGVDIVYHCAATAYEGLSVFSPHMVTQNIVTASTGVISAAVANKVGPPSSSSRALPTCTGWSVWLPYLTTSSGPDKNTMTPIGTWPAFSSI